MCRAMPGVVTANMTQIDEFTIKTRTPPGGVRRDCTNTKINDVS